MLKAQVIYFLELFLNWIRSQQSLTRYRVRRKVGFLAITHYIGGKRKIVIISNGLYVVRVTC